jgi:glycosyltransferase involved in cell wall biosynthesis
MAAAQDHPGSPPAAGLRIAQVITRMIPGGASRIVLDLIRGAPPTLEMTLITGPEGLPADLGARIGACRLHVIPTLGRAIRPLRDLRALRSITRLLREGRFDVAHAHTSKAGFVGRMAAARAGVRRIIYTPHGSIFLPGSSIPGVPGSGILRRVLLLAERRAGRRTHLMTALSRQEMEVALELGLIAPGRVQVIPNGIEVDRYAPSAASRSTERRRLDLAADDLLVVAAGRLTAEKGHAVLLESAALLRGEFPSLKLAFFGEGPLREELARKSAALFPGARFPGFTEDLPAALAAADVFAHPALYEGFGLAPLEAMAAGLPVAASSVGGLPELISAEVDGLLVPPGDPAALAAALRRLLGSRELRERLGGRARSRARDFSRERMVAAYAMLYRNGSAP